MRNTSKRHRRAAPFCSEIIANIYGWPAFDDHRRRRVPYHEGAVADFHLKLSVTERRWQVKRRPGHQARTCLKAV